MAMGVIWHNDGLLYSYTKDHSHRAQLGISVRHALRYDTIEEFNVDSKAEYSALSSTGSQKLVTQTTQVPL